MTPYAIVDNYPTEKKEIGRCGEELAAEYLEKCDYQIIERNWQPGRWGEVDIVAIDNNTLVFVEVKVRGPGSFETPQESVTRHKKYLLKTMAQLYYKMHLDSPNLPEALRIDFVGISFPEGKDKPRIKLFKNITG